jgi:NAD(P)-dependent dehydrogenase (short-subunit alcohol dehydrogenase family)
MNQKQSATTLPPQQQNRQPGSEQAMHPAPESALRHYLPAGKLKNRYALITGGDSGIGRAVAVAFAKEGADVLIAYLDEHEDARETEKRVKEEGRRCLLVAGDMGEEAHAQDVMERAVKEFGRVDILVNNAAEQHIAKSPEEIDSAQLQRTFRTNLFSYFYLTRAALPHLPAGGSIINTTSVTAYKGNPQLIDYSATKGAIVSFTRSLSQALVQRGVRVNAVAPGPVWTPLIPASFTAEHVQQFGANTPMGRPGQPDEVAPCYVFLASDDASYITGQVLHPNGGTIVNG